MNDEHYQKQQQATIDSFNYIRSVFRGISRIALPKEREDAIEYGSILALKIFLNVGTIANAAGRIATAAERIADALDRAEAADEGRGRG